MANLSDLPHDLLIQIAKRVYSFEDFISYGDVCTSWRAAATKNNYTNKFPQIPWLILTQQYQEEEEEKTLQTFISLKKGALHKVLLPQPAHKLMFLSSQGWLLSKKSKSMCLLHPFSRAQICLPSKETIPACSYFAGYGFGNVTKFCLSNSPSVTSDYLVILVFGCLKLIAFCRPGDIRFTTKNLGAQVNDVAYYENKLYCVDATGLVLVCDINEPNPNPPDKIMNLKDVAQSFERLYILELGGKLVVVSRNGEIGNVKGFRVFEMNLMEWAWFEMNDIGDMAIFLGYNSSFSVEACNGNGCKANCIYFTSDCFDMLKNSMENYSAQNGVYVYNLLDGRVEEEPFGFGGGSAYCFWIEPSF